MLGGAALPVLAGCQTVAVPIPTPPTGPPEPLIDVHCHLFNESDLPAVRFIKIVFAGLHRPGSRLGGVEDPDLLDGLIWLFARVFAGKGPTATAEIRRLQGRSDDGASVDPASDAAIERDLGEWLAAPIVRDDRSAAQLRSELRVRRAIVAAAGGGRAGPRSEDTEVVARQALSSQSRIGVYLRWFRAFRRYRYQLTDELIGACASQGFKPALLTPAMIDYARWLGETPRSPLADQVSVFSAIARRPGPTAIHGYVAFDPLHQVYAEMDRWPSGMSAEDVAIERRETPLQIVKRALETEGFLGIKLYPPMGFRASGNASTPALNFPDAVKADLRLDSHALGQRLDAALEKLYALCTDAAIDAPILAHGGEGNEAGGGYGRRADPYFWLDVARRHPTLRICLAHFGGFGYVSAAPDTGLPDPLDHAWEGVIGAFVKDRPGHPLFADIAYFVTALNGDRRRRAAIAELFNRYRINADPNLEHVVFGSDWIMLGNVPGAQTYSGLVRDFLRIDCGLSDEAYANVMWRNATRFLGLKPGAAPRARLEAFYRRHGLDAARLARFDA